MKPNCFPEQSSSTFVKIKKYPALTKVKLQWLESNKKSMKYSKKQENIAHMGEISQLTKIDPKVAQMTE